MRYEAPSRASLDQYPILNGRHSRSPVRREHEEGGWSSRRREQEVRPRTRDEEPGRRERDDWRSLEEEQDRRRREDRSKIERYREERGREERKQQEASSFLDLAQLVRQEVQRAFLSLLPPAAASGPPRTPTVTPAPSWAELMGRSNRN